MGTAPQPALDMNKLTFPASCGDTIQHHLRSTALSGWVQPVTVYKFKGNAQELRWIPPEKKDYRNVASPSQGQKVAFR